MIKLITNPFFVSNIYSSIFYNTNALHTNSRITQKFRIFLKHERSEEEDVYLTTTILLASSTISADAHDGTHIWIGLCQVIDFHPGVFSLLNLLLLPVNKTNNTTISKFRKWSWNFSFQKQIILMRQYLFKKGRYLPIIHLLYSVWQKLRQLKTRSKCLPCKTPKKAPPCTFQIKVTH